MQKLTNNLPSFFILSVLFSFEFLNTTASLAIPLPTLQEPQKPIEFPKPLEPTESPLKAIPDVQEAPVNIELPRLKVLKFIFIGNTVISTKSLEILTAQFLNKTLLPEDLQKLQQTITEFYTSKGYTNSGAFINKEDNTNIKADDAVLTIKIIEGGLESYTLEGTPRLQKYLKQQIDVNQQKPFNSKKLLNNLRVLQDDPLIGGISATIDPPNDPTLINAERLDIKVTPKNPYRVVAFIDNNGNSSSGSFRQGILFDAGNPFGQGDNINLAYAHTDGTNALNFEYSIPVTRTLTAKVNAFYGTTLVTQSPFDTLNIRGTSYSADFSLDKIIYQKATENSKTEIDISAGFNYSRIEESLLGIPFQVSEGATADGITDLKLLHFDQHLSYRDKDQAVYLNSSILGGVDLDSATAPLYHNGAFIGWQGDMSYTHLLPLGLIANARLEAQIVDNPVPSVYQFELGGQRTVRGTTENLALGYNGIAGTVQLNKPLLNGKDYSLVLLSFLDAGKTWDTVESNGFSRELVSVGGGIEASYKIFSANLTYGHVLNEDLNASNSSLQTDGFTFIVRCRVH